MSSVNEAPIYAVLVSNEDARRILELCKTAKTTDEIKKAVFGYKRYKYPSLYGQLDDVETLVGQTLAALEIAKAIAFKDSKWETTAVGLSVLAKYFGL